MQSKLRRPVLNIPSNFEEYFVLVQNLISRHRFHLAIIYFHVNTYESALFENQYAYGRSNLSK